MEIAECLLSELTRTARSGGPFGKCRLIRRLAMAAIPNAALHLGVIFGLMMASLAGQAAAQEPPAAQARVCDRLPASGAKASDPTECCCAAPAKIACCAVAPEG